MNMDALGQYFDHYVISARIKPAFFVVLPLATTALAWWPEARQLGGVSITLLATFGVIGFLSNLISNHGNALQNRLFEEWGGAPTVALLRFRDPVIDPYTKARYHRQFQAAIPSLSMPTPAEEQADPSDADDRYASASGHARERCRDKAKFPLVYADNVAYGYARNLLLMKPWGIASAGIALAINVLLLYLTMLPSSQFELGGAITRQTMGGLTSAGVSAAMCFVFMFVVDKQFVRGRAVRYAKSLLAACETLGPVGKKAA